MVFPCYDDLSSWHLVKSESDPFINQSITVQNETMTTTFPHFRKSNTTDLKPVLEESVMNAVYNALV